MREQRSTCAFACSEELRQLLSQNELQIRAIQTMWEQHLQEALKDWEQQYANIAQVHAHTRTSNGSLLVSVPKHGTVSSCQERRMMQMHPYILNVNEDVQLSGVVKLFIQEGKWVSAVSVPLVCVQRVDHHPLLRFCDPGEWNIGLCDSSPGSISLRGLG